MGGGHGQPPEQGRNGIDLAPDHPAGPPAGRLARTGVDQLWRPRRRQQPAPPHPTPRPPEPASSPGDGMPPAPAQRPPPAAVASAAASTASAAASPAGASGGGSGSTAHSSTVKTPRTSSAREANRASQPRTVEAGRPS